MMEYERVVDIKICSTKTMEDCLLRPTESQSQRLKAEALTFISKAWLPVQHIPHSPAGLAWILHYLWR